MVFIKISYILIYVFTFILTYIGVKKMKKKIQKIDVANTSKFITKYNEVIAKIKKLNTVKSEYQKQILDAVKYNETNPKKLYVEQFGSSVVMVKVSQSYTLDLKKVKKDFPILDVEDKAKSKYYKLNSPKKEFTVENNND